METTQAAQTLSALAQPTRLDIFRALVVAGPEGLPAGALAAQLAVAPPVLSFHLKELRFADLVGQESRGRFVIYRARYDTMDAVIEFLTQNCCSRSSLVADTACCTPSATPINS